MADNTDPPPANDAQPQPPSAEAQPVANSTETEQEAPRGASLGEVRGDRVGDKRKVPGKKQTGRAEHKRARRDDGEKKRKLDDWNRPNERPKPNLFFNEEEVAAEERRPKKKVSVQVGYAGSGYLGLQINGEEPTIERDLFRAFVRAGAISKANANDPKKSSLVRCARTDKGVHAAGNVLSLKLIIEDEDIVEKINKELPEQIRVWGIQRSTNGFSCYQMCDSRWYEYLLPSHALLPPHPATYLGKMVPQLAKEHGMEEDLNAKMEDVKDFWTKVEEEQVKPILERLDPDLRARVLERIHVEDDLVTAMNEAQAKDAEEETNKAEQPQTASSLPSHQPKKRNLEPLDYALRDIKEAYMSAKRNYRISPSRLQRLQEILTKYQGTRNYHNYTVQKSFTDPSAKRHIKSFVVNPEPIIINNTEWLSLKVHGQSFMMHQIRKMVGLACLMVRCGTPIERVSESYAKQKMAIPKAPSLGLLLERPVFENYNRKAEQMDKETIDFSKYEDEMLKFKQEHIYNRIFETEEKENAFHAFFNQIDQFKQNHFLWVTAGGMAAADYKANKAGDGAVAPPPGEEGEDKDVDPTLGEG